MLRPLATSDLAAVMALAGEFQVARMLSDMPHPATRENIAQWLRRAPGERRYAIELDGRMIGSVGYFHLSRGRVELGYWLGSAWWGHGYAREAVAGILHHAGTAERVRQVSASYFIDNAASGKVLQQLGFTPAERRSIYCPARQAWVEAIACERVLVTQPIPWLSWLPWPRLLGLPFRFRNGAGADPVNRQ